MSHETYLAECAAAHEQPSFAFRCPGLTLEALAIDGMHSGDLGSFGDALGGLFFVTIRHRGWFANQTQGLEMLNVMMGSYYKANSGLSEIKPLNLKQIVSSTHAYPTLKGKAAQARDMNHP